MPFKDTYILEGLKWCFDKPEFLEKGLAAKYQKNARVKFKISRFNSETVNAYVDSQIIGFINDPEAELIIGALINNEEIHAKIASLAKSSRANSYQPEAAWIEISTFARPRPEAGKYAKPEKPFDIGNPTRTRSENTDPIEPQLHRILNVHFKEQRKKEKTIKQHSGTMGIYCIWSKTHETYIGQSVDIGRRISEHCRALWAGEHTNKRLQEDWALGHTRFRFDVIEEINDESLLDQREAYYITEFDTYIHGYNSTPDGQGYSDSKSDSKPIKTETHESPISKKKAEKQEQETNRKKESDRQAQEANRKNEREQQAHEATLKKERERQAHQATIKKDRERQVQEANRKNEREWKIQEAKRNKKHQRQVQEDNRKYECEWKIQEGNRENERERQILEDDRKKERERQGQNTARVTERKREEQDPATRIVREEEKQGISEKDYERPRNNTACKKESQQQKKENHEKLAIYTATMCTCLVLFYLYWQSGHTELIGVTILTVVSIAFWCRTVYDGDRK